MVDVRILGRKMREPGRDGGTTSTSFSTLDHHHLLPRNNTFDNEPARSVRSSFDDQPSISFAAGSSLPSCERLRAVRRPVLPTRSLISDLSSPGSLSSRLLQNAVSSQCQVICYGCRY